MSIEDLFKQLCDGLPSIKELCKAVWRAEEETDDADEQAAAQKALADAITARDSGLEVDTVYWDTDKITLILVQEERNLSWLHIDEQKLRETQALLGCDELCVLIEDGEVELMAEWDTTKDADQ